MVSKQFRRGTSTPRRSRRAYYTRRRQNRLGATSTGNGFRSISPQFMRQVKNRPALRSRGYLHAMIRPIVVVSVLSTLAYGVHFLYQRALISSALSIQSVRLHQVPNMFIEPVRARLRPAYGKNLLALDLEALRTSIEELPAVHSATARRVLPDGLIVSVEARDPKVRVVSDQTTYIIDREGVVLETYDRQRPQLPKIRLRDGGSLKSAPGEHLTDDPQHGRSLLSALAIVDWMAQADGEFPKPVDQIRIDASGFVLVTTSGQLEIVLGDERRMAAKMAAVRSLLQANPTGGPAVIDARYTDMLVVLAFRPEED